MQLHIKVKKWKNLCCSILFLFLITNVLIKSIAVCWLQLPSRAPFRIDGKTRGWWLHKITYFSSVARLSLARSRHIIGYKNKSHDILSQLNFHFYVVKYISTVVLTVQGIILNFHSLFKTMIKNFAKSLFYLAFEFFLAFWFHGIFPTLTCWENSEHIQRWGILWRHS